MKPVVVAKILQEASTRWTSKNQILTYIYTLFLDHFCVLIVMILC